jgi:Uma2 family endonuclease
MGEKSRLALGKITYEEFLEWCNEDTWAEWVDGEIILLSPASTRHQDISDFLVAILRTFVEARRLGRILSAPFQMKTGPELPGREPDIIFVSRENLERLKESHLEGPADLVIEIISPESLERDKGEKFEEYEEGGVREYWLIDPDRKEAEFYILGEEGNYRLIFGGSVGEYRSEVVPGFWLRVDWLWEEPLPSPLRVIGEISGIEPSLIDAFESALRG